MGLERLAIVLPLVAEHGTERVEGAAVGDEPVPVIVADLMAEMAQQRAVGLAHRGARRSRSASSASARRR